MSSDSGNITKSKSKSKSNEEEDANNETDRNFRNLEDLMTFIGSRYPHFRKTVLPILLVYSFLYFSSRYLTEMEKLRSLRISQNNHSQEFFYSKCYQNNFDDSVKIAKTTDFLPGKVPRLELTIVTGPFLMFGTTTVSPRKLILTSLIAISVSWFVMAQFANQLQIFIYFMMVFTEIYRLIVMVTLTESVPRFHRLPALIMLELVSSASRTVSTLFVRLPADTSLDMSHCFEIFGFITIIMALISYYTFEDSLYSLLARTKSDQMQEHLDKIFRISKIRNLPADAVIDQIAFENFENNENPIEILLRTLRTKKLLQEVLICGVISGTCLAINAFIESELNKHSEVMYFEKSLIPGIAFTISGIILLAFAFVLPKKRILPVILTIPFIYLATAAVYMIPGFYKFYDRCTQHWIVESSALPAYATIGILTSALTDVVRFFVKLHMLEVIPVLVRAPLIALMYFVQYSFDGNVRDFYSTESVGGELIMILISILAMLILLITPRKRNDMNVFFSEYINNDKKRKLPPAPIFVN